MNEQILHFAAISSIVGLPALGVGIGQGIVNSAALKAIDRQPAAYDMINRITIISLALSETAALLGVVMGVLILMGSVPVATQGLPYLGIILALAIPGCIVGIVSSLPGKAAVEAAARQPLFSSKIMQLLPITQTMIQTPVIFGFIIGLVIKNQMGSSQGLHDGMRLCATGLSIGLGSIGPSIGLAQFAAKACAAPGINREAYQAIRTFTFISQALIEAPIIFSVIVSLLIAMSTGTSAIDTAAFMAIAIAMGLSTLGTGIGSGRTSATAVSHIALQPKTYNSISRASILSQTFIDTSAIYALLVALVIFLTR